MNDLDTLLTAFHQYYGGAPAVLVRAPGRVNLIGEHTDYNDGYVLPMAIDRAVLIAASPTASDSLVSLAALDVFERTHFRLNEVEQRVDIAGEPLKNWARYPAGVAWALRKLDLPVRGAQAVYASTVPIGSGLSSSAAVEMAFAVMWQALGGWRLEPMALAQAAQRAEVEYVGVNSGLMDQFASAHGRAGHALFFDCRTLDWRPVPLPPGAAVIVADTKVRRLLGESAYNTRNAECREAVRRLSQALPGIRALRDVTPEMFQQNAAGLPEVVRRRAQHVVEECERVLRSVDWLSAGDLDSFGQAMNDSHASLRDLYEVSCPELDVMVETAQAIEGCFGARLTGAGFGGCAVALVADSAAPQFKADLALRYEAATGLQPEIFICKAAAGAAVLSPA